LVPSLNYSYVPIELGIPNSEAIAAYAVGAGTTALTGYLIASTAHLGFSGGIQDMIEGPTCIPSGDTLVFADRSTGETWTVARLTSNTNAVQEQAEGVQDTAQETGYRDPKSVYIFLVDDHPFFAITRMEFLTRFLGIPEAQIHTYITCQGVLDAIQGGREYDFGYVDRQDETGLNIGYSCVKNILATASAMGMKPPIIYGMTSYGEYENKGEILSEYHNAGAKGVIDKVEGAKKMVKLTRRVLNLPP
jgi:hypothetical protein